MSNDKLSTEEQLELEKCKNDPVYFIEKYCRVNGENIILDEKSKQYIEFYRECNRTGKTPMLIKSRNTHSVFLHKLGNIDIDDTLKNHKIIEINNK